jgi:AAHS family 4-hydroxybenzoate transporter-like MFS transporter
MQAEGSHWPEGRANLMAEQLEIDIARKIDDSRVRSYQLGVVILCALIAMLDGIDVQAMALVTPIVAKAWGVERSSFGLVLSAGFAGIMIGAMVGGILGDRMGRRRILIGAFIVVGLMSVATALARNHGDLMLFRFLTGLGIGACMPNFTALAVEYVPTRRQGLVVTLIFSAIPLGGIVGGYAAPAVTSVFGWQGVFVAGGVLPLALAVVLLFYLPESVRFLAKDQANSKRIGAILSRIDPAYVYSEHHRFASPKGAARASVTALFATGLGPSTLLLWGVFFCSLFSLYMLTSWLPSVLTGEGWSPAQAGQTISVFFIGGLVGGVAAGWAMDRLGGFGVLGVTFLVGSGLIYMIGRVDAAPLPMFLSIGLAGFAVVGGQTGITAVAAKMYPTAIRSTGVGWGLGVGRSGAVISPFLGALALAAHWDRPQLFSYAMVPAVLCGAFTFALLVVERRRQRQGDLAAS